jgi:hypothetical protein
MNETAKSKALSGVEEEEVPLNHYNLLKRAFLMAKTSF